MPYITQNPFLVSRKTSTRTADRTQEGPEVKNALLVRGPCSACCLHPSLLALWSSLGDSTLRQRLPSSSTLTPFPTIQLNTTRKVGSHSANKLQLTPVGKEEEFRGISTNCHVSLIRQLPAKEYVRNHLRTN